MDASTIHIQINFEQILEAVKQLTPDKKLELNELMWENDMSIPKETQDLVLDRIEKMKANPELMLDWDEVSKDL